MFMSIFSPLNSNPSESRSVAMSGFFEEVKRRKVYRVAAAYIIAAGGIIQLASAAFPAWELPNWALRLVIVVLLMGFPIALMLAWAYDITAQGIRATPTLAVPGSHRRRNIVMLVMTGVIISAAAGFFLLPRVSAHKCDKSIAVLPFENLSDEKENAYFADGIQDDVLTNLSKIGDLKVISRTSVMPYRGKTSNVREIGKALGVGAILEGSVRRIGNRVRVNVQLINADTDEHLWAEDYDRDLTDVFAIQTDLAQQIVRELQAKLSPIEKAQIERRPTENSEAYLAFVKRTNCSIARMARFAPTRKRRNSFSSAQLNWIRTSRERLPDWHGSTIGLITISIRHLRERKKRVSRRRQRFVCSRICPKGILHLDFIIIIASVIIRQRCTNSLLRN